MILEKKVRFKSDGAGVAIFTSEGGKRDLFLTTGEGEARQSVIVSFIDSEEAIDFFRACIEAA